MLGHELLELLLGVGIPAGLRGQQRRQVVEHLLHPRDVLGRDLLHRLLHALEALFEEFGAQHLPDFLEGFPRIRGTPVVVRQLRNLPRDVRRQRFQLQLAEPRVLAGVGR